jgi:hypothetical protein
MKEIELISKNNSKLSKNQIAFKRLTERIYKLENVIQSEIAKNEKLVKFYIELIVPQKLKLAEIKIQLALNFDESSNKTNLSPKITNKLKISILQLCEEAFEFIEVTPEIEKLFDTWSDISYQDELLFKKNLDKHTLSEYMENVFNKSFNLDDVDLDDPESVSRFQQRMKEIMDEKNNSKSQKKSIRQLKTDELQNIEEIVQNKSIRSVYISLTKVLHPDTELDEQLKKEKEELMKLVTQAYNQKDLATLLRLEMEWVFKTNLLIDTLAEDKLKIYITVLKERVSELEQKKYMLKKEPRFLEILPYLIYDENRAIELIKEEEFILINEIEDLDADVSELNRLKNKSDITEFIEEFYEFNFGQIF